jgi:hypothetical protein
VKSINKNNKLDKKNDMGTGKLLSGMGALLSLYVILLNTTLTVLRTTRGGILSFQQVVNALPQMRMLAEFWEIKCLLELSLKQ